MLWPGGGVPVGATVEGETRRRDGLSTEACDRRCIGNVGEDVGCGKYVHREARPIPGEKKAPGGWRSALSWIWIRRSFHPDCDYKSSVQMFSGERIKEDFTRFFPSTLFQAY